MSKASDLARLVTSGSTAIHGEAGVTSSGSTGLTTNLQQGLCKQWCKHTGSGVTVVDTFNTSSVKDSGTGLYAPVFTNNMSNATYTIFCTAINIISFTLNTTCCITCIIILWFVM